MKNYEDKLLIDKNSLDMELIRQAHTYYEIGIAAVEAKSKADACYENLKAIDAAVATHLREVAESNSVKLTEASLAAKVQSSVEHTTAQLMYFEAKRDADKLSVCKDAFATRAYMLRDLVSLYSVNYFTNDSVKVTNGAGSDTVYETRKKVLKDKRNTSKEIEFK